MNDDRLNVVRVISNAKHTDGRQQRRYDHGVERRKPAELEQQHREHEQDGEDRHDHQVVKRTLLLGEGAAVLDANRRRQVKVGDRALDGGDAGAEVDPLEPRRDRDVALQVFAADFSLAGNFLDRGERAERTGPAGSADQQRVLDGSTDDRVDSGNRTRIVYGRSFSTTGVGAGSPCSIALMSSSISCGVKPARAAIA